MKKIIFLALAAISFAACNNSSTGSASNESTAKDSANMSKEDKEQRNKDVALSSLKAFDGDAKADEVFKDADKDVTDYGTGEMPATKGIDSSKAFLQMWLDAFPDYKGSDFEAVADGDYVMVYGTWAGTWKNDFMGMKPTGKSFKYQDVDIFKFNDEGKITEHRAVQSVNEIARQIGMRLPPPEKK